MKITDVIKELVIEGKLSDYGLNISHKATFTYNNTLNELR